VEKEDVKPTLAIIGQGHERQNNAVLLGDVEQNNYVASNSRPFFAICSLLKEEEWLDGIV